MVTFTVAGPPPSIERGIVSFPLRAPPASRVIVYSATTLEAVRSSGTVLAIFPVPMPPVKLTVPAIAKAEKLELGVAVAFTVNVVLILAAGAAAQTSSAKAKVENVRFIGLSESSTRETQEFRETWFIAAQHRSPPGGLA